MIRQAASGPDADPAQPRHQKSRFNTMIAHAGTTLAPIGVPQGTAETRLPIPLPATLFGAILVRNCLPVTLALRL